MTDVAKWLRDPLGRFAATSRHGGKRTVQPIGQPKPPAPRSVAAKFRRVVAESVYRDSGRITLSDFAHVRTRLTPTSRGGYAYRGAGYLESPGRIAKARSNFRHK